MFFPEMIFKIVGITRNITHKYKKTRRRKYSTLYYKLSGSVIYTVNGETYNLSAGDILFIPKCSEYIIQEIEEGEYISLHMESEQLIQLPPRKYRIHNETKNLFLDLWRLWLTEKTENIFECYSIAYKLFALITHFEKISYASKSKYNLISCSVDYLEKHMFDNKLDIITLGTHSGISYIYFYKLFKEFFNSSPSEYIKNKRITYAKNLFDMDETLSVSQVAEMAGYSDPLYFSRLFKKETGVAPKEYIKCSYL